MSNFLFPLRYLALEGGSRNKLVRRDVIPILIMAMLLAAPFLIFQNANYAHDKGFLDRVATFLAVLTGFYFAGLIAVASLSSHFADLDKPIAVGEVRLPSKGGEQGEQLTRRQYVCYMFGYMAFLSIILSILALFGVVVSAELGDLSFKIRGHEIDHKIIRGLVVVLFSLAIGSLFVTTIRGLYYLVERLYDQEAVIDNSQSPDDAG